VACGAGNGGARTGAHVVRAQNFEYYAMKVMDKAKLMKQRFLGRGAKRAQLRAQVCAKLTVAISALQAV
jgi:hypothetical protein